MFLKTYKLQLYDTFITRIEKSKLMEKERELLDTEKMQLSSLLEEQKKRTEQLETENKELLSQIEKEKKISQEVSGNLYILYPMNCCLHII